MMNPAKPYITARTGRQPIDRPTPNRPAGRPNGQRPEVRHIDDVLVDLADTAKRYQDLRNTGVALEERARLTSVLHELRAEASLARSFAGRP